MNARMRKAENPAHRCWPSLSPMAIAPSPTLETTPVRTRRRIALTLLIAVLGLFGLDALLFRTHGYMSILEPDSSAGLVELLLWREKRAQRTGGDNLVVTLGNSRMGFVPKVVDLRPRQTGYVIRTAAAAGSDPRVWYYMLRDLDPTARRYRAIVLGVDDYDDEDRASNPDDGISALHYCIGRLRWGDTLEFARSFHSPEYKWEAFRGSVLKGIALQSDIQAFLSHPVKRIKYVRLCHQGWPDWIRSARMESAAAGARNRVARSIDQGPHLYWVCPGISEPLAQPDGAEDSCLRHRQR